MTIAGSSSDNIAKLFSGKEYNNQPLDTNNNQNDGTVSVLTRTRETSTDGIKPHKNIVNFTLRESTGNLSIDSCNMIPNDTTDVSFNVLLEAGAGDKRKVVTINLTDNSTGNTVTVKVRIPPAKRLGADYFQGMPVLVELKYNRDGSLEPKLEARNPENKTEKQNTSGVFRLTGNPEFKRVNAADFRPGSSTASSTNTNLSSSDSTESLLVADTNSINPSSVVHEEFDIHETLKDIAAPEESDEDAANAAEKATKELVGKINSTNPSSVVHEEFDIHETLKDIAAPEKFDEDAANAAEKATKELVGKIFKPVDTQSEPKVTGPILDLRELSELSLEAHTGPHPTENIRAEIDVEEEDSTIVQDGADDVGNLAGLGHNDPHTAQPNREKHPQYSERVARARNANKQNIKSKAQLALAVRANKESGTSTLQTPHATGASGDAVLTLRVQDKSSAQEASEKGPQGLVSYEPSETTSNVAVSRVQQLIDAGNNDTFGRPLN